MEDTNIKEDLVREKRNAYHREYMKSYRETQEFKEKRRIYQREYMNRRRKEDPEFAKAQCECAKTNLNKKYSIDDSFKEKRIEDSKAYYRKLKDAYVKSQETEKSI